MSSPFQTKEFKALQAKWDTKLKKSGFEDAEQRDGNLKSWHSEFFKLHHDPVTGVAKEDYYRAAGYFLYEYEFKTEVERKIWELHAEGLGIREIVKILRSQRYKVYKRKVHELLKPLVKEVLKRVGQE